ncbi:hypothetical protein [Arvimicrobium flavum]|uniref:hypothetical protein n=1 Tax=Arvimicrobium flavum TaxID=3393320 RepID=UPI00237A3D69|nr:hypothetical protein [Mesorhizobium shangrilense]
MSILFTIIRNGNDFSCRAADQLQFFVGRRVPYEGNIGLYNIFSGSRLTRLIYEAANFKDKFGFWASFIEPTAICEGRNFLTLNSYDRAAFTFGFGQFAAHVPNGDFVRYFRAMLGLPGANEYFPHLGLIDERICRTENPDAPVVLETDESTDKLMKYLNPDLSEVQDAEVIAAAKLIHWTTNSVDAQAAQVNQMIATFRSLMRRAENRVGIDGRPAAQCAVIADILHQGRAGRMTWPLIDSALRSPNPLDRLLKIGLPKWEERLRTLRRALAARPEFQVKRWSSAHEEFV